MLSARAAGAEPIVITDLFQSRLDFAKKLVPGVRAVLIERGSTPKISAEKVKVAAEGPIKLALECSGVENSIHTAIYVCRNRFSTKPTLTGQNGMQSAQFGGKVFIIGVGKDEQAVMRYFTDKMFIFIPTLTVPIHASQC